MADAERPSMPPNHPIMRLVAHLIYPIDFAIIYSSEWTYINKSLSKFLRLCCFVVEMKWIVSNLVLIEASGDGNFKYKRWGIGTDFAQRNFMSK